MNAATTLGDVTAKEQGKIDYEALARLVDSVTKDYSKKSVNSRLKALARKSMNAATISAHVLPRQTEHNIKASTAEGVKSGLCSGCQNT
jgi:hypothetical protein